MKCAFNAHLRSDDTILMNLYKRVFPKWSFDPHVTILPPAIAEIEKEDDEEEVEEMIENVEKREGEAYQLFD